MITEIKVGKVCPGCNYEVSVHHIKQAINRYCPKCKGKRLDQFVTVRRALEPQQPAKEQK